MASLDPWKIAASLVDLVACIALGMASWTVHEIAVVRDEGRARELSTLKEISVIREKLASLPNAFPPPWFVDKVDSLSNQVEQLKLNQQKIMTKLGVMP